MYETVANRFGDCYRFEVLEIEFMEGCLKRRLHFYVCDMPRRTFQVTWAVSSEELCRPMNATRGVEYSKVEYVLVLCASYDNRGHELMLNYERFENFEIFELL